jgi:hypothetical protein
MELHNFEALLHITAVANLAYTAFHGFSENIKSFFTTPFTKFVTDTRTEFSKIVQRLKDEKKEPANAQTVKFNQLIDSKYLEFRELVTEFVGVPEDSEKIEEEENNIINRNDWEYGQNFKGLYLVGGLYTIFLLFLTGTEGYFFHDNILHSLFITNCLIGLLYITVFVMTFTKARGFFSPLLSLLFFIIVIILFSVIYHKCGFSIPDKECIVFFSITLSILPFILHILRIAIELVYLLLFILAIRIKYKAQFTDIENQKLEYSKALDVLNKYEKEK